MLPVLKAKKCHSLTNLEVEVAELFFHQEEVN